MIMVLLFEVGKWRSPASHYIAGEAEGKGVGAKLECTVPPRWILHFTHTLT